MEFDKSKVYTPFNADMLKPGCTVIVADTLGDLKSKVTTEAPLDAVKLQGIRSEFFTSRFEVNTGYKQVSGSYVLAYLVEEPAKLKWTDLKVGDLITNGIKTAVVTVIDLADGYIHICIGGMWWLSDDELKAWRKVNENND